MAVFTKFLVGIAGFEPTTSASRRQRSTKLSYIPKVAKACSTTGRIIRRRRAFFKPLIARFVQRRRSRRLGLAVDGQAGELRHAVAVGAGWQGVEFSQRFVRHLFCPGTGVLEGAGGLDDREYIV